MIGVSAVSSFVILIIILYFYKLSKNDTVEYESKMLVPKGDFTGMLSITPTVILAFNFQYNLFPCYFSLKDKNQGKFMSALYLAVFFCAFVYIIVGIVGFLTYGQNFKGSVLDAILGEFIHAHEKDDTFFKILLFLLCLSCLIFAMMSIPMLFISFKKNFLNMVIFCKKQNYHSKKKIEILGDISEYEKNINLENAINEIDLDPIDEKTKANIYNRKISHNINRDEHVNVDDNENLHSRIERVNSAHRIHKAKSFIMTMPTNVKRDIADKIESKYLGYWEKIIITIIIYCAIVISTILISMLSTVRF